jgi:uncharacterized protein (TIGR03435 family)
MKKWMVWIIALMALPLGALEIADTQKIAGKWQGAIKTPNGQLRVVIEVSSDSNKLKADFYSIDQQSPAIPASTVACDGSIFKLTFVALNGNYEGKISSDGKSILGTWSQGGQSMPLDLARATPETAWAIPEPPPPPKRMSANSNPAFEVATIKPSDPSRPGKVITVRGADVIVINNTLSDLIMLAYGLHSKQIIDAPGWIESEKFDITGRPDIQGQPNVAQIKAMIQKLLADRFQLKFHKDTKELSVYALTVAKGGPKFAKSERDPDSLPGLFFRGPGTNLYVTNAVMGEFAGLLQSTVLDRPVVDQTGLTEKYDFVLKWTPDAGQFVGLGGPPPQPTDPSDAPPDLFAAIQQQLGLKLSSTKASTDVIIIEHVEKPSEN